MNDRKKGPGEPHPEQPRDGQGEQLLLVRPVVHVRASMFDEPAPLPQRSGSGERVPMLDIIRAIGPYLVTVIAIGVPFIAIAGGEWWWVVGGLTLVAIALHELARRVSFTFAEGFLAFRNGDEWPHGVQEEYDVRYSWPPSGSASTASVVSRS